MKGCAVGQCWLAKGRGTAAKSGSSVSWTPHRISHREKNPRFKAIKFNQAEKMGAKLKVGVFLGVCATLKSEKASIHAG